MKGLLTLFFFLVCISPAWANKTYEDSLAGKSCEVDVVQQFNCKYKIGKDLEIWIDGIGSSETAVTFARSDIKGDYYATFGMHHLCVIVKSGTASLEGFAFISPMNGNVYEDWQTCKAGISREKQ